MTGSTVHRVSAARVLLTLLKLLVLSGFCGTVGVLLYQGLHGQGSDLWRFWFPVVLVVVFGGAIVLFVLTLVPALASAGVTVAIDDKGLIHRRPGGHPELYPWTDLAFTAQVEKQVSSRTGHVVGITRTYRVTSPGMPRLVLDHNRFFTIAELGAQITERVVLAQVPRVARTLSTGGSSSFGPFRVDPTGITYGKSHLAWPDCRGAQIVRGVLFVRGPVVVFAQRDAHRVPNAPVLVVLVNALTGGGVAGGAGPAGG